MNRFFNSLIEKLAYECPLRDRFGLLRTGDVYTAIAWSMNHLYSRIQPKGAVLTVLFCGSLTPFSAIAWMADQIVRPLPRRTGLVVREAY